MLVKTPLPVDGSLAAEPLLSKGIEQPLDENELTELEKKIEEHMNGTLNNYLDFYLLLLVHLDQTGSFQFIDRLWELSGSATTGTEEEEMISGLRRYFAFQLVLSCKPDNALARDWGLKRLQEVRDVLASEAEPSKKADALQLMKGFVIPFTRLHPRLAPVQELAKASLKPSTPLYQFRTQLIPILAYNPDFARPDEIVEGRMHGLIRARREALRVKAVLEATLSNYPRQDDTGTSATPARSR